MQVYSWSFLLTLSRLSLGGWVEAVEGGRGHDSTVTSK